MNYDITIIIPCFNEEDNVERLIAEITRYVQTMDPVKCEVIFIDDGSTDGTFQKIKQASHKFYAARIIRFSRNFGSHAALFAGIRASRGLYTTYLAADLQYPLEIVGQLYRKCLEGFDLVRLERDSVGDPFLKRVFSKGYAALMRSYVCADYPVNGFDIVMFHRKVRQELEDHAESNSSILLRMISLGFKQTAIPGRKLERQAGQSKWTWRKNIKLMIDSFVSFSYAPVRGISLIGFVFFAAGVLYFIQILCVAGISVERMILAVLLTGLGVTNMALGIIGEYLWRTFEAVRPNKIYVIDNIVDLN
ncbi:MAG: glycosyltransferase family 2 protein [Candidatus Omnitrophota bacterium]